MCLSAILKQHHSSVDSAPSREGNPVYPTPGLQTTVKNYNFKTTTLNDNFITISLSCKNTLNQQTAVITDRSEVK